MKRAYKTIDSQMTAYPSLASESTPAVAAIEFMDKMKVRHLPVLENGRVTGVISDRDLQQAKLLGDSIDLIVGDLMTRDPYCVPVGTPLVDVVKKMAREKYGCALVLNAVGDVVGIFTTTDGMRVLAEMLATDPGIATGTWSVERVLDGSLLI